MRQKNCLPSRRQRRERELGECPVDCGNVHPAISQVLQTDSTDRKIRGKKGFDRVKHECLAKTTRPSDQCYLVSTIPPIANEFRLIDVKEIILA